MASRHAAGGAVGVTAEIRGGVIIGNPILVMAITLIAAAGAFMEMATYAHTTPMVVDIVEAMAEDTAVNAIPTPT